MQQRRRGSDDPSEDARKSVTSAAEVEAAADIVAAALGLLAYTAVAQRRCSERDRRNTWSREQRREHERGCSWEVRWGEPEWDWTNLLSGMEDVHRRKKIRETSDAPDEVAWGSS